MVQKCLNNKMKTVLTNSSCAFYKLDQLNNTTFDRIREFHRIIIIKKHSTQLHYLIIQYHYIIQFLLTSNNFHETLNDLIHIVTFYSVIFIKGLKLK